MRAIVSLLSLGCAFVAGAETMSIRKDETVVFYPSIGRRIPDKNAWQIDLHGSVFEPEKRAVALAMLRAALGLKDVELSAAEEKVLKERVRPFLVDHERNKRVAVRFGLESFSLGKSTVDGQFSGKVTILDEVVRHSPGATNASGRWVSFFAATATNETRAFRGNVLLLDDTGLSVISDIDDTIKVTDVTDRNKTLRNTFTRDFTAVPGMARLYRQLAREQGAQFHYVSASPWQLYEPLATFLEVEGFPSGSFALKKVRWKNRTVLDLFGDPEKYKPTVIEPLLKQFPKRRFILIGDSGERDPEIYAALARKFPKQIERIYIRDVTNESATAARYRKAFAGLPEDCWKIFKKPEDLLSPTR